MNIGERMLTDTIFIVCHNQLELFIFNQAFLVDLDFFHCMNKNPRMLKINIMEETNAIIFPTLYDFGSNLKSIS